MLLKNIFFLILIFCVFSIEAQEFPPISNYSPKEYGAENQNWAISQSKEKYIYVANNKGLLEFNGADWQLYPTPNEAIMRSVKAVGDKIFTGFYMDFGFWKRNKLGELSYISIAKAKDILLQEDEQFWNIIELDGWVIFQSLQRIYLYNLETESVKIITADNIVKMLKVNDTIYFQQIGKGMFKIEKGKAKLFSDASIFKTKRIISIFEKENRLLFLSSNDGFFIAENNKISPWHIPADKTLLSNSIYSSTQLSNGDFILGTIANGMFYLYKDGTINYQLNQEKGLINNTILSVFEDEARNLWLGLDNGIGVINVDSPFRVFNNRDGDLGTVYASIVFNDVLYLGTNQGLFYKKYKSKEGFKFISNTQGQVWCLVKIDENLFCGHNSGTFLIENEKAIKQIDIEGTWNIKKVNDNTAIQGNYNGLNVLKKINNTWQFNNKIEGFDISSRYFELYKNSTVFVNHEYKGVYKLKVDKDYKKVIEVEKDSSVVNGINSSLLKYQDQILYAYKKGVFSYDDITNSFKRDSILSRLYTKENYTSGKLIYDKIGNKLWGFSKKYISYVLPGKLTNKAKITKIPIEEDLRKGVSGFENNCSLEIGKYLFGVANGYIIVDLEHIQKNEKFTIKINQIHNSKLNDSFQKVYVTGALSFNNAQNNIQFNYSIPVYDEFSNRQFRSQLIGLDEHWSDWTNEAKVLYKNLPFGSYTFKVQGRVDNMLSENIASYQFIIKKPWYLSGIMIVVYLFCFLIFSVLLHNMYKYYYNKQRDRYLENKQREFELKNLESQKELMQLKNKQLKLTVDVKSKELASSTMSIIKKNEFLSSIKSELKSGEEKSIRNVIKIIDKNLNNTDDWQLFKEAFNNADKDFIKKLKTRHPALTPNDLRLCAYLRLNLSSKEIAPLLNISHRSVEVKRYRLRKKMDLPHDTNLTNYILEV